MALLLSSPTATVVFNVNVAAPATPDPPSVAVHNRPTSLECQRPSAGAHDTVGAFLSIMFPAMLAGDAAVVVAVQAAFIAVPPAAGGVATRLVRGLLVDHVPRDVGRGSRAVVHRVAGLGPARRGRGVGGLRAGGDRCLQFDHLERGS